MSSPLTSGTLGRATTTLPGSSASTTHTPDFASARRSLSLSWPRGKTITCFTLVLSEFRYQDANFRDAAEVNQRISPGVALARRSRIAASSSGVSGGLCGVGSGGIGHPPEGKRERPVGQRDRFRQRRGAD